MPPVILSGEAGPVNHLLLSCLCLVDSGGAATVLLVLLWRSSAARVGGSAHYRTAAKPPRVWALAAKALPVSGGAYTKVLIEDQVAECLVHIAVAKHNLHG